jgi:hypothetical protein
MSSAGSVWKALMTNRPVLRRAAGAAPLLLSVLLAGACSSSPHATASASPASASPASASSAKATTQATCEQIGAVLSDGPDPDADPVGYAQAQVLPLRHVTVASQTLRTVVGQLADAYQQFYSSNGKSTDAKEAVAVATKKLNSICPGAAS